MQDVPQLAPSVLVTVVVAFFYIFALGVLIRSHLARGPLTPVRFLLIALATGAGAVAFIALWGIDQAGFALLFSTGVSLSLFDPFVAVGFLVLNLVLRPWELVGSETMAIIPKCVAVITAFSWVYHGIRERSLRLVWNLPFLVFGALAVWFLSSAATSGEAAASLTAYMNTFMIAGAVYVFILNLVNRKSEVETLSQILVLGILGVIAAASIDTLTLVDSTRLTGRGQMGNANDLAALCVLALPLLFIPHFARNAQKKSPLLRLVAGIGVIVLLFGIWLSQSRGAFIALMAAAFTAGVGLSKRPRRAFLIAVGLMPFAVTGYYFMSLGRGVDDVAGSTQSRWSFIFAGLRMAIDRPLLGIGFNRYPEFFENYAGGGAFEWGQRTAHSTWILALAENGFPAFFLLLALFIYSVVRAWALRFAYPALFPAIMGYGVAITFLSHTYLIYPYVLLALILAADRTNRTEVGERFP